ncbi:hypothetical protein PYW07_016034 [Mythimna separata]|uniref:DNA/RNA non-specific endonuclease domain-containing protein n=1 Tax=Mythimna separata TaxID=271217 RepID=A0AAD7YSD2_MYTSE|nr:hypothetical protein PYW07_016034 [Mythimna separata]
MRLVLVLAVLLAAEAAKVLKDPSEMALVLDEDEFEAYLDEWLEQEQSKLPQAPPYSRGCTFKINGDLGQPQPVYLRFDSIGRVHRYLAAEGNIGQIHVNHKEPVVIACPEQVIQNVATTREVATAICENNNLVSGAGWLNGNRAFGELTCSAHLRPVIYDPNRSCWNGHSVILVGYNVTGIFYQLYGACFDQNLMQSLYVWYDQTPAHAVHQTRVPRPSTWQPETFFPGVNLNTLYTQASQRNVLGGHVGQELAGRYITRTNQRFLAKGHLAAKSDFVFASAQRATFFYINAAPQWQCINAGNWNRLEQKLRARIAAAGYNTVIYTGTYGVVKLPDQNNRLVDIFLSQRQVPVPLYFYKVAYEESSQRGTAFITINNPHLPLAEAVRIADEICEDQCRRNSDFDWLTWEPDRVEIGYSFCCTVDDFRSSIPHLPRFQTIGLLY